jgi:hypothetical protein
MVDLEKQFDTAIVACSDPRVTPVLEILQRYGDYVNPLMIRVPGAILNRSVVAEIEESGAGRALILDHTDCGAHKHILKEMGNGASDGSFSDKVIKVLEREGLRNGGSVTVEKLAEMLKRLHTEDRNWSGITVTAHTVDVKGLAVGRNKTLIISDDTTKSSAEIAREVDVDIGSAYVIKAKVIKSGYVALMREVVKDKETGAPGREVWLVDRPSNLEIREKLEQVARIMPELRPAGPASKARITR